MTLRITRMTTLQQPIQITGKLGDHGDSEENKSSGRIDGWC